MCTSSFKPLEETRGEYGYLKFISTSVHRAPEGDAKYIVHQKYLKGIVQLFNIRNNFLCVGSKYASLSIYYNIY